MRKFFWGLLKWLLLCLVIAAVAGGVYYLVEIYHWPWWGGATLLSAIAGVVVLVIVLRRYMLRYREKQFVERVVQSDARRIAEAEQVSKLRYQELQQRWLDAVKMLRGSKLNQHGNPLYTLPWYLVFGESESGKTSAITHCGLTSVLSKVGPESGMTSTRNCDWWFFEEAVVLDTAGRYAVPLSEQEDEQEWLDFLGLLAKYRRQEPVNGLVVTVPAEKLLAGQEQALQEYGRYIGARLDRLARVIGARIPIYLVITKADQIYGFVDYAKHLSAEKKRQPFGFTSAQPQPASGLILAAVDDMVARLNQQLLQTSSEHINSGRLAFASELGLLAEPLKMFCDSAFGHQNYHEEALLRGLYLTSALQPVAAKSQCLEQAASSPASEGSEGLFLHDLFARLLPGDRNLFEPISEFLRWRTLTSNLSLLVVLLGTFAVVGVMSLGYIDSEQQIRTLHQQLVRTEESKGSVEQEIMSLQALQQTMSRIHREESQWYLPKMTLEKPVYIALQRAQQSFVKLFAQRVLAPANGQLISQVKTLDSKNSSQVSIGDAVDHLSWQLQVIHARLDGSVMPGLSGWARGSKALAGVDVEYQNAFALLYSDYVLWLGDSQLLQELATSTRQNLAMLLTTHSDLNWITQWASDKIPPVRAASFWQLPLSNPLEVPGAYTEQGYRLISILLRQIQVTSGVADIQDRIKRFKSWYALRYLQQWKSFNSNFVASGQNLSSADRKMVSLTLDGQDNPFISLQRRTLKELSVIEGLTTVDLSSLKLSQAIINSYWAHQEKGIVSTTEQGQQLMASAFAQDSTTDTQYFTLMSSGEKAYSQLEDGLSSMLPTVNSESAAARSMGQLFSYASPQQGAVAAHSAVQELHKLLSSKHKAQSINGAQVFLNMYQFIMDTELDLAACHLQNQWQSNLYGVLKYIPTAEQRSRLFSQSGLLTKFLEGPAKPFIELKADGWHPASYNGMSLPFNRDFFSFIEQGSYLQAESKDSYSVQFKALPLNVNPGAKQKPFQSSLILQCAAGAQTLQNYNYPITQSFTWKPKSCGTTRLQIDFNGLELTRSWQGSKGFEKFLQEFRSGEVEYTPADFPDQAQQLQEQGIQWIRVKYQISGAYPVLSLAQGDKLAVPMKIAHCQGGLSS
ncbi:type VI secretion protein IcmF/TssM N-terminal domain-containing protein [Dongshaea marina]|uniref:type VI secretion protein IcmF/TssM N-terminal domain-containing protein n=1 Tax=Dongshaea marina TaxID=2047966 RepID=UPI000D3EAF2E|nr:type VI secretion protein IcmF/TssM N-terminal domain-containing protein [Dongshaea marina]